MDKVVYVVGYRAEMVEDKLAEPSGRLNITTETVFNPVYDMTNNLISLWLARQEFDEDAVITNGDNLFFQKSLRKSVQSKDGIFLTISLKQEYDDMKDQKCENNETVG